MASGYSNKYLAQIRAAREAAAERAGLTSSQAKFEVKPSTTTMKVPKGYGELSTGNPDLDEAHKKLASTTSYAAALGNEVGVEEAKGDPGFLNSVMRKAAPVIDFISQPIYAVTETVLNNAEAFKNARKTDGVGDDLKVLFGAVNPLSGVGLLNSAVEQINGEDEDEIRAESVFENFGSKNSKVTPGDILKGSHHAPERMREFFENSGEDVSGLTDEELAEKYAPLRADEDDNWLQKAAKFTGGLAADVALDPVTYVPGIGLVSGAVRGTAKLTGAAARTSAASALENAARAGTRTSVELAEEAALKAARENLEAAQRAARQAPVPVTPAPGVFNPAAGATSQSAAAAAAGFKTTPAPVSVMTDLGASQRVAAKQAAEALPTKVTPPVSVADEVVELTPAEKILARWEGVDLDTPGISIMNSPRLKGKALNTAQMAESIEKNYARRLRAGETVPDSLLRQVEGEVTEALAKNADFATALKATPSGSVTTAAGRTLPEMIAASNAATQAARGGVDDAAKLAQEASTPLAADAAQASSKPVLDDLAQAAGTSTPSASTSAAAGLTGAASTAPVKPAAVLAAEKQVAEASIPRARQAALTDLADGVERMRTLRGGRGVRQEVNSWLNTMGFEAKEAARLSNEILAGIQKKTQGGLGGLAIYNPITNNRLIGTAGAGRNVDRMGLGKLADAAHDSLTWVRATAPWRKVADNFNGTHGAIMGDFLRSAGTPADFAVFKAKREAAESAANLLGDTGQAARTRLSALHQLTKDKSGKEDPRIIAGITELWGRGEKANLSKYTPEELVKIRAIVDETKVAFNEAGEQLVTLREVTDLISKQEAADFRKFIKTGRYQPRILTKESAEKRQLNTLQEAGVQGDKGFNTNISRKGVYQTDPDDIDIAMDFKTRAQSNLEATEASKAAGSADEFVTNPIAAYEHYVNKVAYTMSRLQSVKVLKDAGIVRRISKDTPVPEGMVSVGGNLAKDRILPGAAVHLITPAELGDPISRLLTMTQPKIDNYLLKSFDSFQSGWKPWATLGRGPGYHVRNFVGLSHQNYLGGVQVTDHALQAKIMHTSRDVSDDLKDYILKGKTDAKINPQLRQLIDERVAAKGQDLNALDLDELLDAGIMLRLKDTNVKDVGTLADVYRYQKDQRFLEGNRLVEDLSSDMRTTGSVTRDANRPTLFRQTAAEDRTGRQQFLDHAVNNWWIRKNSDVAQGFETFGRGAAFIRGLKRFGTEDGGETANAWMKSLHFDYSDLSELERNFVKRFAVPFYTFTRNNIPSQLFNLAAQPGKFNALFHFQENLEEQFGAKDGTVRGDLNQFLPNWNIEKNGFISQFGSEENPLTLMLENPATDLNKLLNGEGLNPIDMQELGNMVNPLIKTGIETWSEKDFSTGADMSGAVDTPWYMGLASTQTGPDGQRQIPKKFLNVVGDLLPPVGMVDKLQAGTFDEAMGRESKQSTRGASNWLSWFGAPVSTFDDNQEKAEVALRTQAIQESNANLGFEQGINQEEATLIRAAIKKGYSDEYIQELVEGMRNN